MQTKKNILITGSQGGLGMAAVRKFQERGWIVTGMDLHASNGLEHAPDHYSCCDVTDREAVVREIDRMEGEGIHFDALLVAAGIKLTTGFEETDMAEWKHLLNVWLGGGTNACKAVSHHMIARKSGRIMMLCPDYRNEKGDCIMNAVAGGTLHGFAKSFGAEVAARGVRVNVLWPGLPFDYEAITEVAFYLADADEYTAAQVISIAGEEQEAVCI